MKLKDIREMVNEIVFVDKECILVNKSWYIVDNFTNIITDYENKIKSLERKADLKMLKTIPMQLCPKCSGVGEIINNIYGAEICPVCNGKKIIPMHIVERFNK